MRIQFVQIVKAAKFGHERTFRVYNEGEFWTAIPFDTDDTEFGEKSGEGHSIEAAVADCWQKIQPNLFNYD